MGRKIALLIIFMLMCSTSLYAKFCNQCGKKMPDAAKFCQACGGEQKPVDSGKPAKAEGKITEKPAHEKAATPSTAVVPSGNRYSGRLYKTKTELYAYERRGDEKNVLKKNLFTKPRRYKIQANVEIKILEELGGSYLVESLPDGVGKIYKGWVLESELLTRSDWTKKNQ